MSESRYIEGLASEFVRRFPRTEGWRVHTVESRSEIPLRLLPAFLQNRAVADVRADILTALDRDEKSPAKRINILEAPHTRDGDGITLRDWRGEMEFVWEGSPVVVRRTHTVDLYGGQEAFCLVAERDHPGFEGLMAGLSGFGKELELSRQCIYVLGDGPRKRPVASWDDVILPAGMRDEIRGSLEGFLKAREAYAAAGLAYRRGFLFSGPPGCGKTMTVRAMAANIPATVVLVELTAKVDDWRIQRAFSHAKANAPCMIILEDIDHIMGKEMVSLSYVLNLLDGLDAGEGVVVVATTNHPEKLDPALIQRPSRFDRVWRFGLPGRDERLALLERRLAGKVSAAALEDAAARSGGFTMAYVQEIAASALLKAINEGRPLAEQDLRDSIEELRRQVREAARPAPEATVHEGMGFAPKSGA